MEHPKPVFPKSVYRTRWYTAERNKAGRMQN